MFDFSLRKNQLPGSLGPAARDFIDAIKNHKAFQFRRGAMQLMVYECDGIKIGGLNPIQKLQYILKPYSDDKISDDRLNALGFKLVPRSNGSLYWQKRGVDNADALRAAIEEMTGLVLPS